MDASALRDKKQKEFNELRRDAGWRDSELAAELDRRLCHTCKLFRSNYAASHINFADLLPGEEDSSADKVIQVRDGVGIDRDSEKAVDGFKYDYEVVDSDQTFLLRIDLEDPTPTDLALTCLGLSEYSSGFGYIGGHRSRGLGNCRIEALEVYELDLNGGRCNPAGQPSEKVSSGKNTGGEDGSSGKWAGISG